MRSGHLSTTFFDFLWFIVVVIDVHQLIAIRVGFGEYIPVSIRLLQMKHADSTAVKFRSYTRMMPDEGPKAAVYRVVGFGPPLMELTWRMRAEDLLEPESMMENV